MNSQNPAIVTLDKVSFAYRDHWIIDDVNLTVRENEFLGIVGPNAGGKSTLLKLVLGLLIPDYGTITLFGKTPAQARHRIGYVPQYPLFRRDFPITVRKLVLTGTLNRKRMFGRYTHQDRLKAEEVMERTETVRFADKPISTLSGGQLQRVLLARALAGDPGLLLLDEPTANIDMRLETEIFDLLKLLNTNMTVVVVSHDIAFISAYVNRVACLNSTLVCHTTAELSPDKIEKLYGSHVHAVDHNH